MLPGSRILFSIFAVLLFNAFALGQSDDRHLTTDPAHVLYNRSAFAHGYIHGYEDGFHNADLEIHMGRGERSLTAIKEFRDGDAGYDHKFGDKQFFCRGYKHGFQEGYSDAIRGGQFRAVEATTKAASEVNQAAPPDFREKDFDKAFAEGYDFGRKRGAVPSSDTAEVERAGNTCTSNAARNTGEYCDAFIRGFEMGFDDGRASLVKRRTQTARK